jgi:hypothetical protein
MKAFLDAFWLLALVFVAFVPLVWLMRRSPEQLPEAGETLPAAVEPA